MEENTRLIKRHLLNQKLAEERDSFEKCIPFWKYDVNPITMTDTIRERATDLNGLDEITLDHVTNRYIGG